MRKTFKKCKLLNCNNPVLLKNRLYCCIECSKKGYVASSLEKYGTTNPLKNSDIRTKAINTTIERYGVKNAQQKHISKDVLEKCENKEWLVNEHHNQQKSITKIAKDLGIDQTTLCRYFHKHSVEIKFFRISEFEKEIVEYIKTIYNGEIITNSRTILYPNEIDIYIPQFRLAIECNGIYWHTEISGNRSKDYHLKRFLECSDRNINLLNITDLEWDNKRPIIKSILKSKLNILEKIYARKCHIEEIPADIEKEFLEINHIQGYVPSSFCYGLFCNNDLVSLMSFGKSRFEEDTIELLRFCNKIDVTVIGGASKLFNKFIGLKIHNRLISYSHKDKFTGNLYKQLGFKYSHSSKPSYYYTNDYREINNRIKYQKHKLSKILSIFDPELTEWENMQNNGFDRIWDCGNDVWVFEEN